MPEAHRAIGVLIADDHPILRAGLRKLLEAEPGFRIVGEAADGEEAVRLRVPSPRNALPHTRHFMRSLSWFSGPAREVLDLYRLTQ